MINIRTHRLFLIPCSLDMAKAIVLSRHSLKSLLKADVPESWPSNELKGFLPFYIEALEKDKSEAGWGIWLLVEKDRNVVIGDVGFKGKPNEQGEIEIGYGVLSEFRNHGYATEAANALVNWAFTENASVSVIYAECDRKNAASVKVLKNIGMDILEDKKGETILKWQLGRREWNERS